MLTDEQITEALAHIDKRYQKVCRMYLEKVGATIRELGHLNSSRLNLLVQLQKMGVSERQIIRELQKTTDLTKEDIHRLYHKAAEESVQDARYLYLAKGRLPDWQPMEYLVQAMWEQTAGKLDNLSGTTAVGKAYRQIVDEAVTAVTMGVEDYNSAIRNSLRLLGRAGLQTEYESGHHRRLESAVRQNILDGVRQVQQEAQKLIGEQMGADGVEITAHPNSAPDHEPVQGRQFPLVEFEKMQSGSDFQDADGKHYRGFERPITQWRCRHLVYYILLGAAKRMYTDEQLRKWEEENHKGCEIDGKHYTRYEATQLMRKLETEIRKEKDTILLAQASGDDVLRRNSQTRVTQLTAKYGQVAESAGLRTRFDRTKVEGYSPKHAKQATKVETQIAQEKILLEKEKQEAYNRKVEETQAYIKSDDVPKKLNRGNQLKHIKGDPGYIDGKSYIYGDLETAQQLVNTYSGTGEPVFSRKGEWNNKEIVVSERIIGVDVDNATNEESETNRFVIHYGKKGTHVVPTKEMKI